VHDIRILEAADDVEDRIRLANVRQELVAETLAFRCAANEAGDIDDLYVGVNLLLALGEVRQLVETAIDERHDADVRLDGAERIIRAGRPRGGQRVEYGGFADVRQSDDSGTQSHCGRFNEAKRRAISYE